MNIEAMRLARRCDELGEIIDKNLKKIDSLDALFRAACKEQFRNGWLWGFVWCAALMSVLWAGGLVK